MLPVQAEWSIIFDLQINSSSSEKSWTLEKKLSTRAQPRLGMTIKKDGVLYHVTDELWDDDKKAFIVEQSLKVSEDRAQERIDQLTKEGWRLKVKPKRKAEDATVTTKEEMP